MTMGFVTKYGSLFVPVIYWLVYLAARFIYNGLAESTRLISFRALVMMVCLLSVAYWCSILLVYELKTVVVKSQQYSFGLLLVFMWPR